MPFSQRQEFQNYERPAQLNGAPVQVKSEPGVKRDPYEEGKSGVRLLRLQ